MYQEHFTSVTGTGGKGEHEAIWKLTKSVHTAALQCSQCSDSCSCGTGMVLGCSQTQVLEGCSPFDREWRAVVCGRGIVLIVML